MGIGWMVVACLLACPAAAPQDVTAYLTAEGTALTSGARRTASSLLAGAGVRLTWLRPGARPSSAPPTWLRIELVESTPEERFPGSLAVSYPRARCSTGITVFLDRVRSLSGRPDRESALLACVLAHEITHVLQGLNRHSPGGLMKARWNEADRAAIFSGRLGFEDADVQLIRRGLAAPWCGEAASVRGRSEPGIASRPE